MVKIYNYSALNGEYLGEGQADPDPLTPGNWLYPANSTLIKPPAATLPNTVLRFKDHSWSVVPDFRGTVYWQNGNKHTVREIDQLVPPDATTVEPTPTTPALGTSDVNEERDRRVREGVTIQIGEDVPDPDNPDVFLSVARYVHVGGDDTTKFNLLGLMNAALLRIQQGDLTHVTRYRDEGNVIHELTPPEVIHLWSEAANYVERVFQASWLIKDDPDGLNPEFTTDPRWP